MSEKFPLHWLEEIHEKISDRNEDLITLATGKTPSGHIHIGILREIIICDALRRILEKEGKDVRFYVFLDSLDAAKRFPAYISKDFQNKNRGKPFSLIPCPFENCRCESYAYHFGNELFSTFKDFGIKADIIWSHELYKTKKMQKKIKLSLENVNKIKEILKKYILPTLDKKKKKMFMKMQKNWMPVMVICENCDKLQNLTDNGKIKPNRVINFFKDEEVVSYSCPACGYHGKISIYSGRLKLNWRLDWPAKWSIFKTTCEPAGKDHSVKGGAYDTGLELCQEVFNFIGPVKVPYEWLRLGDQDMKTSKGIVFTPTKYLEIADPEIFRMLILRTHPMKHISWRIEEYPQYFESYERMENIFYSLEEPEDYVEKEVAKFIYPLTKVKQITETKPLRIPLRLLIFLSQIQNILSLEKLYKRILEIMEEETSNVNLTIEKFEYLLKRTENWLKEVRKIVEKEKDLKKTKEILNKIDLFEIPENLEQDIIKKLDQIQINGIRLLREFLRNNKKLDADLIQNRIFSIAKDELEISPRKMFEAIYLILLGKEYGPRVGHFLALLDRDWLLERLKI